jgi:hypothetical protein
LTKHGKGGIENEKEKLVGGGSVLDSIIGGAAWIVCWMRVPGSYAASGTSRSNGSTA